MHETVSILSYIFAVTGFLASIIAIVGTAVTVARRRYGNQLSWKQIEDALSNLTDSISRSGFRPDIIVGIGKGGSVTAGMLSARLGYIPIFHVERRVLYREDTGLPQGVDIEFYQDFPESHHKNILIVNGESNSGWTIAEVKNRIGQTGVDNIRTAALVVLNEDNGSNIHVKYSPDYSGIIVKKSKYAPWEREGKQRASVQ